MFLWGLLIWDLCGNIMSQFTTPFRGELIGRNTWSNIEPFEYHVGTYPSEEIITVPIGFITDFASIPRIFWPLISPIDSHAKASVVHDYCYYKGLYSKKKSDLIFKEGLEVLKINPVKKWTMYYFVVIFGWFAWWNHRKKDNGENN